MIFSQRRFIAICQLVLLLFSLTVIHSNAGAETQTAEFEKLTRGMSSFPSITNNWGMENISFLLNAADNTLFMRVFVPQGAIDPGTMARRGLPYGGAGFKSAVVPLGAEKALLSYRVRFPTGFNFVRGGKLPGLYGGAGNSGGIIPNGTDGFSFRLMWRKDGAGEVYAYLPNSVQWGTEFFLGTFRFVPGVWHQITQELHLNTPGKSNGMVRLWFDGVLVGAQTDLLIRTVESLKINGLFFDFFFGGNDDSWAPPSDTFVDFSSFRLISY